MSAATLLRMKNSPSPVPETAQLRLLAYVPAPMITEGRQSETKRPAHAASRSRERDIFWVNGDRCGACLAGRASDFNKVFGQYSFPLRMKSPPPSKLRRLRLEAADAPRDRKFRDQRHRAA